MRLCILEISRNRPRRPAEFFDTLAIACLRILPAIFVVASVAAHFSRADDAAEVTVSVRIQPSDKISRELSATSVEADVSLQPFAPEKSIASDIWFEPQDDRAPILLSGSDARYQVVVSAVDGDGIDVDMTHHVQYRTDPIGIIECDTKGTVRPLANGSVKLIATAVDGRATEQWFEVQNWSNDPQVDFATQIVPLFTKHGCNGGGCHGKMSGQNGFRLSLMGFEPAEDFAHIVHESRGRRIDLARPEESLLLTKAIASVPHGGGARFQRDSVEYRLLKRWIAQGVPASHDAKPELVSLDIVPNHRRSTPGTNQQLAVRAKFSDGSVEDVTQATQYEANDKEMADIDERGVLTVKNVTGEVAVMARYRGKVAVSRVAIPLERTEMIWPDATNEIDAAVLSQLRSLNIPMSDLCDDATFLRRITLDLTGRIPSLEETQKFLESKTPDKRAKKIEELLGTDDYAEFFANKWMVILRNKRTSPSQQFGSFTFHSWIRNSLSTNQPYDEFVRDILAASGDMNVHPPVAWYRNVADHNSQTEDAAQLFLGQRLQCARCHHHPYEKWSQEDYARFHAFFAKVRSKPGKMADSPVIYSEFGRATVEHPRTKQVLTPAGLDSKPLTIPEYADPREQLVDWMTQTDNPFFAKSLVNRYWKHFFGRGLVEPEDDIRSTNPPVNPELMDVLAKAFVESKYDLRSLIRFICNSRTYQLSYESKGSNVLDRKCFSRFYPKRLPAEVLLDAIDSVTLSSTEFEIVPSTTRAVGLPDTAFQSYFLTVFGRPEASTACECERTQDSSLAQSLQLANSKELQAKIGGDSARAAQLARKNTGSFRDRIEELYLIAFSRKPTSEEEASALTYVEKQSDLKIAFEDLTWALLNSKEFLFNH